ncbi:MAG: DUF3368 domain-containing protein [Alphaproteobacteria bacterium]|nr:DUF3368 domain-containing protein [Alphaproteobacteria bacterium]
MTNVSAIFPYLQRKAIHHAVEAGQISVHPDAVSDVPLMLLAKLGAGESSAIRLALELQCPVLMEERKGRKAARRHGVTVIGTAGLLLAAKQQDLLPAIAPILDQWHQAGYFLSLDLVRTVLKQADES